MKRIFNRTLVFLICALFLCRSVPAQLALGPERMRTVPAPTLRNRTRLPIGLRRISFVGKVGGVAFDAVASPASGLIIDDLSFSYSNAKTDGERLSVVINNVPVSAPIYDWQLLPIAKFADSDYFSCFTMFGEPSDGQLRIGRQTFNYHPDFENTLMGLRLFQLDNLIIDKNSWDLVKDGNRYLLGAGESPPNEQNNRHGWSVFAEFSERNSELFDQAQSYVISDNKREIVFDVTHGKLNIQGQPSYYFWQLDEEAYFRLLLGDAEKEVNRQLRANPSFRRRSWLISQLLTESENYQQNIDDHEVPRIFNYEEILPILRAELSARSTFLNRQTLRWLQRQLIALRTLNTHYKVEELAELSNMISNEVAMLRAINPTVWDAGVMLMRYAAFFRYCKQTKPVQWKLFMSQIKSAPPAHPFVITPNEIERVSDEP